MEPLQKGIIMKVRVKPIEEIRKIGISTCPSFVTNNDFNHLNFTSHHSMSMEYYCDKVIELDKNNRFDGWLWSSWMYYKNTNPLLEVEE